MKRKILTVCAWLLVLAIFLTACGSGTPQDTVSSELGLDLSGGTELSSLDTHGGFHGDGSTCIVLGFSGNDLLEQIEDSAQWSRFPLEDPLLNGALLTLADSFKDEEGNALVPEIQEGYYRLIDRQPLSLQAEGDILHRHSSNYTLALYDAETQTLYFCKLDT